jgi:fumarylacetoacetate (FAA) hydrolase family protein
MAQSAAGQAAAAAEFSKRGFHMADSDVLPVDADRALLLGRAQLPGKEGGPAVIVVVGAEAIDITRDFPVTVALLEEADPAAAARRAAGQGRSLGPVATLIANSPAAARDPARPFLQAVKAAGVTFADSLVERVIEERTKGDPKSAESIRQHLAADLGVDLAAVRPGSTEALKLREALVARGLWSQYLEVGLGPDAEVFTKAQPMSSVGHGAEIGIHPGSVWNNPEPEVVIAVNAAGKTVGAMLGNDVNLRDFEGRSALLLGRSKDNNGSCALGPFLRLFEDGFGIDDVRRAEVQLLIRGPDNFRLEAVSNMARISRDPLDLVAQTIGKIHQYPDGFVLFMGTMFAPTQDRDRAGEGFTHKLGDVVAIASPRLGSLVNTVGHCDRLPPWEFGVLALMRNLAQRGLRV